MIELALRNFLLDVDDGYTSDATRQAHRAALLAGIGNRIYMSVRPQGAIDPALTIERIGTVRWNDLLKEPALCQSIVQCGIWGKRDTPAITVVELAEQNLRGAICQYRGTMDTLTIAGITVEREGMVSPVRPEDASDDWTYTYTIDFMITHSQTAVLQPV